MVQLRLMVASIARQRGLYLLWLLSLSLAVTGLVVIDVFRFSLTETLKLQGQKILTADVSVSARRALTEEDERILRSSLPPSARLARLTELFAMISSGPETRLAMLRFVDDGYPLIGDLQVDREGSGATRPMTGVGLSEGNPVWVAPDLLNLMRVNIGSPLKIGNQSFVIAGVIRKDSSQTFRMGNMAPRVYAHIRHLGATGLVQYGSTFSDTRLIGVEPVPTGVKETLERQFKDPSVSVTVPTDLENGSLRVLSRIMDFLGLIGLVTLAMGWIGVYYLGRRWLAFELQNAGILKCLGFTSGAIQRFLLCKLGLILLAGVALGGALSWFGAQAAYPYFENSLPEDFKLVWSARSTLLLLVIGPMAGLLLLYPPLRTVAREKPLLLLSELSPRERTPLITALVLALACALVFFALTFLQAKSWWVTGVFLGALAGTLLLIALLALGLVHVVALRRHGLQTWVMHLATALWVRRRGTTVLLIAVSALAGLLAQLVPNLERTLVGELKTPEALERPGLFLFDIQDEQFEALKAFLAEHGLEMSQASPFIRARLLRVNETDYERASLNDWSTREEEMEARFRNRGVNLSYRGALSDSETIVDGKAWQAHGTNPAEVSVEERYAERVGLKLGDQLLFDVQGVEVPARVASLREVDWNSFQPNFFIQFPEGVLEGAPKTWIMTITRSPKMSPPEIQTLVTARFANVTSINVEEALDNATELIGKLGSGLRVASRLCLVLGLFVFLMILLFQLISSRRDWVQLQVQGLKPTDVWRLQVVTYGGLCLAGSLLGTLMSVLVAWALAWFAFDTRPHYDWSSMGVILAFTWGSTFLGLSWMGLRQLKLSKRLLNASFE